MKSALIFLTLVVCSALAQLQGSYLTAPPARTQGGVATSSQVAPCGEGTDGPVTPISAGSALTVSWANNNNVDDDDLVYLLLLEYPGMAIYRSIANFTFGRLTRTVRIPSNVPAGNYYLQWVFTTYYSCAVLNVSASTIDVQTLQVNQRIDRSVPIGDYHYYEIAVSTQYEDQFVEFYGTGPNGLTNPGGFISIVGRESPNFAIYPTLALYDNIADTATSSNYYLSLCRDNNNEDEFVVGVYGAPGATQGSLYSISVGSYSPTVNALQSIASDGHSGKKFFITEAYTTADTKRRVAVKFTVDFTTDVPQVRLATNCAFTNNLITAVQTSEDTVCMDLEENEEGRKYIEIPPTTVSYSVTIEEGTCKEAADTSSSLVASLALIASLTYAFLM